MLMSNDQYISISRVKETPADSLARKVSDDVFGSKFNVVGDILIASSLGSDRRIINCRTN